jgi:hypothetical protein
MNSCFADALRFIRPLLSRSVLTVRVLDVVNTSEFTDLDVLRVLVLDDERLAVPGAARLWACTTVPSLRVYVFTWTVFCAKTNEQAKRTRTSNLIRSRLVGFMDGLISPIQV